MHPSKACTLSHFAPTNPYFNTYCRELPHSGRRKVWQVRNAAGRQVVTPVLQPCTDDEAERAQACMQDLLQLYKLDDVQMLVRVSRYHG
jgi:hypothetical protein